MAKRLSTSYEVGLCARDIRRCVGSRLTQDVYGLPPLVTRTFGEATSDAKNEQDEERRAKAIRRLDALYRHLSAPARPAGSAGDVMESWLEKNSE